MKIISLDTAHKTELIDLTARLQQFAAEQNLRSGLLLVFCPHTTASITLNENWDADVRHDLALKLDDLVADDPRFRHAEGNSAAHIKASLFGNSVSLIVANGKICLGRWQGVYFAEWDGPRRREVWVELWQRND